MKQKIFHLGVLTFVVLGCLFQSSIYAADLTCSSLKVQVKIEYIYLSSDGGTTWGSDIMGGASDYLTIDYSSTAGQITGYFKQNAQVPDGTYNKIKVVLNSAVKINFSIDLGPATLYYPTTATFDQATGITAVGNISAVITDQWWTMNLTSGNETIIVDFLNASGGSTTLNVTNGVSQTIRVEIYDNTTLRDMGAGVYTSDTIPSTQTRIYVQ